MVILVMVVRYLLTLSMGILPSPLTAVFLPNAKLVGVEHYIFHQILPTSTSAVLASRITVLIVEMIFVFQLLFASILFRAVVSIRRCARRLPWVIEFIVLVIRVSYKMTVQKKWFENLFFFFFHFYFIVCNFFSFEFKKKVRIKIKEKG
jgi:hypothetical protein